MHRFFVLPTALQGKHVLFTQAQAHQLRNVLRMRTHDDILVLDNTGREYVVRLVEMGQGGVQGQVMEQRAATGEPRTRVILYQALLKADKLEWVLQKGTEIGIASFQPISSERSVPDAGKNKFARWGQIVSEAAEQAGRGKIPPLAPLQPLASGLQAAHAAGGLVLIPWELESERDLASALNASNADTIHLFIGPEGGWTAQEIELASTQGAQSVTLGPRILRAETAGLAAASAIFYARGDLSRA